MSGQRKHPRRKPRVHRDRPSLAGRVRRNLPIIRFVAVTAVSLLAMFWVLHLPAVITHVVDPYTTFVASCGRLALRAAGVEAGGAGSIIATPGFSVSIRNVCNGLEVTAIFLATVLAFPATWRYRLLGLLAGYPAVFLINIARIVALVIIGMRAPELFEDAHYYYAQGFVILATVGVWLLWVSFYDRFSPRTDLSG